MHDECFTFDIVDPSTTSVEKSHQWHCDFTSTNNHIFPRTLEKYKELAENGQMLSAKDARSNLVGLVYFNFEDNVWEIGGLMVSSLHQNLGIGSILMRLALGHLLFEEDPLNRNENIITHAHADNQDPRNIIKHSIVFKHRRRIEVDGVKFPGLKVDGKGKVHGDEFELTIPDSLIKLADWCEKWNGKMKEGQQAEIILRPEVTLKMWGEAFREMAIN